MSLPQCEGGKNGAVCRHLPLVDHTSQPIYRDPRLAWMEGHHPLVAAPAEKCDEQNAPTFLHLIQLPN